MDEKKLTKQLRRITIITIIGSLLLSAIGFGIFGYIMKSAHEAEHAQLQAETTEYKGRLLRQMDKNLQILTTLSKAYEVSTITDDPGQLGQSLMETNAANDFVSMVYMRKDGTGLMHTTESGEVEAITMDDLHPYAVEVMESALQGKNTISKIFRSQALDEKIFVYAVPVFENGEVVGALAAGDTINIFTDATDGKTVMGGAGYLHLIADNGMFLVRSENTLVDEEMKNLYEGDVFSEQTKEEMRAALEKGESVCGEYTYEGNRMHFYMVPLDVNGWYLFCANKVWGSSASLGDALTIFGVLMTLMLILMNVLLYSGRRVFSQNIKTLIRLAYEDPITGAKNTAHFDESFQQILETKQPFSTVALNVHNFKGINDLFGRMRGDRVLCYMENVLNHNLKEGEFFCRDTADLFYLLLLDTDEESIKKRLAVIIEQIRASSLEYGEFSYDLSLYAGVAIGEEREKALLAMQSIEHTHHTDIAFYNHDMHNAVRKKNSIESQMYPALQNKEFKLFLQPKFGMKNEGLVGAEALVRWQNPDGSYRYPNEFIPLFEENGFCLKLDLYMVERACEQIKAWKDAGLTPVPISVNQSKMLFSDLNYPDNLMQILNRYQVSPSLITLEILEGVATDNLELLNHQIEALHALGFRISMDDFGNGYSSLNMLYQLNIDELKLDRGFLRQVSKEDEERRYIILEQIVSFARKLGIATVAEGIETQEDEALIQALKCNFGQGYFYDKPMSAKEFSQRYMKKNEK